MSPPVLGRQQRQLAFISEYTDDLTHVPGSSNVVADALSRPSSLTADSTQVSCAAIADNAPLDLQDMAVRQILCPQVQSLRQKPGLHILSQKEGDLDLWGDAATGTFRPLVPATLRRQVFDHLHGAAHPGMRASRRLIAARYVWPNLAKDITTWARECLHCQQAKVHRQVQVPAQHIPVPTRRFSHIHVDLVGPLPPSKGCTHLFTIIDRTTRWPEAIPLSGTTTLDCASALFQGWVSRFGVPAVITSDRGAQFTSSLWAALCTLLNIQHAQTTAYHPQSNGLVERFHRRLKEALRARLAAVNWMDHLPWVLLGLRAAPREEDSTTPAQAVFGSPLILPGQFLDSPELSSSEFLSESSRTLGAAKHPPTQHNTADPSARPGGRELSLRETGRPRTADPAALRQALCRPPPVSAPLHPSDRGQDGQGLHIQAEGLQQLNRTAGCTTPPVASASRPLQRLSAAGCDLPTPSELRPCIHNGFAAGTVSPWHAARGFCTPRR